MCCKLGTKIITTVVIAIAVILALIISIWHEQGLNYIIFISRFFDVMLPILAVGALLKYLLVGHGCCKSECGNACACTKEVKPAPKTVKKGKK